MRSVREFGAPEQILTGFASWLRYCSDVVNRMPIKLCTMFGCHLGCCIMYTCSAALAPDGISPRAKFTLRPSLAFSYIGSVTARHSCSGVSQSLRRGTRNGSTELSQRTPPMFGWAAMTLGIGPHSSLLFPLPNLSGHLLDVYHTTTHGVALARI